MIRFFEIVAVNVAMASLLAGIAWSVGRGMKRPALAHGLWLLVLLKLITPPLIALPILWTDRPNAVLLPAIAPEAPIVLRDVPPVWDERPAEVAAGFEFNDPWSELAFSPAAEADAVPVLPIPDRVPEAAVDEVRSTDWSSVMLMSLAAVWAIGSIAWFALAVLRLRRFAVELRNASPAPTELQARVAEWSQRLEISTPRTLLVPGLISPMLWVRGWTPRLILPAELLARLVGQQGDALLIHELAHWKRGDHWVRRLEMLVLGLYWWCPLAWWTKARLEECEEECCDAWVVSTLPEAARDYALALVETLDFLAGACPALPPTASGLGRLTSLQRRLTMIVRGPFPRALTVGGVALLLGVGALLVPLAPTRAQAPKLQEQIDKSLAYLQEKEAIPPRKEVRRDGDEPKKGPRDGEEPKKGPRDGDRPRKPGDEKGPREGDGPRPKDGNPEIRGLAEKLRELEMETKRAHADLEQKMRMVMELRRRLSELEHEGGPREKGNRFAPGGPGGPNPDVDRRLSELERKMDMILRALNREGGQPGPMAPMPPRERKDGPPPPPRKEGERRDGAVELELDFAAPIRR